MNHDHFLLYRISDLMDFFFKRYHFFILPYFYALWYYNVPLSVINAETVSSKTNERLDNSLAFSRGCALKYPDDDSFCKIVYTFQNKTYAMAFHKSNPLQFPPYGLTTFAKTARPGIASIVLLSDGVETDVTEELRQYAGPKMNFYNDLDYKGLNWEWIELHKKMQVSEDAQIRIMNTRGEVRESSYFTDT